MASFPSELDPVTVVAARSAIALLLALAAAQKLRGLAYFRATLAAYRIVPDKLLSSAAIAVPVTELSIATAVLVPGAGARAMLAAAALMGLYAGAMAFNILRGRRDIDCGCSGPDLRQSLSGWLIARNGALALVAIVGMASPISRPLGTFDMLVVVLAVSAGAVLYAAVNQLAANLPRLDALDAIMEQS